MAFIADSFPEGLLAPVFYHEKDVKLSDMWPSCKWKIFEIKSDMIDLKRSKSNILVCQFMVW